MPFPILTSIVALPIVGAVLLLLVRGDEERSAPLVRNVALMVSLLVFAETLLLWTRFNAASSDFQFVERHAWMPAFGIEYFVGVDGISLLLLALTAFLTPLALLGSWESVRKQTKSFSIFVLLLESAMMGVFISLDLFLFYIFWDAMLVPMYFLIGIWGYDRRIYASIKFMLYTMAGSVLMLLAILGLAYLHYTATGGYSFDLLKLYDLRVDLHLQFWFFLAFALAFAIKVPLFPFHTWLPDAHVEAPTAGSVILAGVMLKMGTYGLVRFAFPLFPEAAAYFAPALAVLAVVGIIYGALVAMVQPDMKKLVAYSSVSHLGFVVLGIAAFLIVTLASIGLPGLNGFVGEFLILLGAFRWDPRFAAFAATGVILSATYMLWMFQRVNYGPVTNEKNSTLADLQPREWAVIVPIIAVAVLMGVLPNLFLRPIEPSVERMLNHYHQAVATRVQANRDSRPSVMSRAAGGASPTADARVARRQQP